MDHPLETARTRDEAFRFLKFSDAVWQMLASCFLCRRDVHFTVLRGKLRSGRLGNHTCLSAVMMPTYAWRVYGGCTIVQLYVELHDRHVHRTREANNGVASRVARVRLRYWNAVTGRPSSWLPEMYLASLFSVLVRHPMMLSRIFKSSERNLPPDLRPSTSTPC